MRYWHETVKKAIEDRYGDKDGLNILEVGVYQCDHTQLLLESYPMAKVVAVDVVQPPLTDELMEAYPGRFLFIRDMSLNIIPHIEGGVDVVLLDGDHNHYTVYNELKLLYESQDSFPLVILHDVDTPWSRKDFYYVPESIPLEGREPTRQGVLSAVEDFITDFKSPSNEYYFKLTLHCLPPSLGVLEKIMGADI